MDIKNVERIRNEMAGNQYKAVVNGVECWIPDEPLNRHYQELKKQEREGKIVIADRAIDAVER